MENENLHAVKNNNNLLNTKSRKSKKISTARPLQYADLLLRLAKNN